ncbi:MAG TPA: helix-turn-helix transcriptional regulator [Polyangiaceae bacterium]|jgi:DNA-binding CsgD family transcriptional regulator
MAAAAPFPATPEALPLPRALAQVAPSLQPMESTAATEEWRALLGGRLEMVDHFEENGRRYLIAVRRPPRGLGPHRLSPREREVCERVARGDSNKHVAYDLGLSPSTVAAHLGNAMRKLDIHSRVELIQRWNATPREEAAKGP